MPTQCNTKPLEFEPHGRRRVVADFDGGPITSDAGALLLRRVDRRLSLSDQVAACFTDHRDPKQTRYSLRTLIAQRIRGIALGYEDLNDQLRHDPLIAQILIGAGQIGIVFYSDRPILEERPSCSRKVSQIAAYRNVTLKWTPKPGR